MKIGEKNGITKRLLSLFAAAAMLCTMLCAVSVSANTGSTAEILMAGSRGEFFCSPQSVTVDSGTAEKYGYTDSEGIVTTLDALVQMHVDLYGTDFESAPAEYLIVDKGFIKKVNGADTSAVGFMVNKRTPNNGVYNDTYGSYNSYTIAEAPLVNGDVFEFYMYQDTSYYADEYYFFDKFTADVAAGEAVTLTANCFTAMFGASKEETIETYTEAVSDTEVYIDEKLAGTTDDSGSITLTFDKAGRYLVYTKDTEWECIPAWCIVNVAGETASPQTVAENIAAGIAPPYAAWELADLAAYGSAPNISNDEIQAITDAAAESKTITDIERAVIELTAVGKNASALKTSDGKDLNLINKISELKVEDISYVTEAIFALLAYDSGSYTVSGGTDRDALIEKLLAMRNADGIYGYSWNGVDYADYDSAAMALAALAPYTDKSEVKSAVDTFLKKLSEVQGENGSWGSANTDAMVICGLAALGVDIDGDTRFIKNENTAVDGLMSYAVSTLDGFYYSTPDEVNALATEQGFRALAAYLGAKREGGAFSVYKFADFLAKTIKAEFEVYGDTAHGSKKHSGKYPVWIKNTSVELEEGATVMKLFCKILDDKGYTYKGADKGYISEITSPDGVTLAEKTNGSYSGWLYTVNGDEPDVGMADLKLKDGDKIRVYYTDDWRKTYNPNKKPSSGGGGGNGGGTGIPTTVSGNTASIDKKDDAQKDETADTDNADKTANGSFSDVPNEHWARGYIEKLAERGIIKGYENGKYLPDNNISRAELCVILSRCANAEANGTAVFDDVPSDEWYAPYIAWAAESGIVNGVGNNRFEPDAQVSRQDLCVMLVRCADLIGANLGCDTESAIADFDEIADYAAEAVQLLVRSGIVVGDENSRFNPNSPATRAEIAKIICGIL